ncbi:hypothetical protein ACFWPK_09450 [Nocardia sp. NPDC058519]|uniref:hypothetical protein n=1 Tax=Nocardia sp. NPDC058519 TaxID=3346535 RepID=UPI0036513E12
MREVGVVSVGPEARVEMHAMRAVAVPSSAAQGLPTADPVPDLVDGLGSSHMPSLSQVRPDDDEE